MHFFLIGSIFYDCIVRLVRLRNVKHFCMEIFTDEAVVIAVKGEEEIYDPSLFQARS